MAVLSSQVCVQLSQSMPPVFSAFSTLSFQIHMHLCICYAGTRISGTALHQKCLGQCLRCRIAAMLCRELRQDSEDVESGHQPEPGRGKA